MTGEREPLYCVPWPPYLGRSQEVFGGSFISRGQSSPLLLCSCRHNSSVSPCVLRVAEKQTTDSVEHGKGFLGGNPCVRGCRKGDGESCVSSQITPWEGDQEGRVGGSSLGCSAA